MQNLACFRSNSDFDHDICRSV